MSGTNQEIISAGLSGAIINGWQYDDLVVTTGTPVLVAMTSSVATGGTNNVAPTNSNLLDINGTVNKTRTGMITSAITTVANSRAQLQGSNTIRFQIYNSTVFGFGADVAFNGGQIDFANDPVFQLVGWINSGVSVQPTQGAYIRPPYVGETNFYKYVLTYNDSISGLPVNVITDSNIVYDSNTSRFLNIFVLIDAPNDSITYSIKAEGQSDSFTISNVLVTYPDMWSSSILNLPTVTCHRAGAPVVGVARSIITDKLYRYIKPNYEY
jgi:hypothetical protein